MNKISIFFILALAPTNGCIATQDSMLRPRVQLAQLKAEVDELLECANVQTISQVKRTIKELQTKYTQAAAENTQLRDQLEAQKQEATLAQERNKQLAQSLKKMKVFKAKSTTHFEALRTLIDAVPENP
jgi:predicted nuclease with TOPRIM domain